MVIMLVFPKSMNNAVSVEMGNDMANQDFNLSLSFSRGSVLVEAQYNVQPNMRACIHP